MRDSPAGWGRGGARSGEPRKRRRLGAGGVEPPRGKGGILEGIVVLRSSREARVETALGLLSCSLRGRFRQSSDLRVVVGDRVRLSPLGEREGVIEEILPRRTELWRATADLESVLIAANVDRLLVVAAAREPPPRWALVDRMLVAASHSGLEPGICLNKWDQVRDAPAERGSIEAALEVYRRLGYPVFVTSAVEGLGLEGVEAWLRDRVTAFAGHSGVGKSTLLNRIDPALGLETQEVNAATGKGRHTTSVVRLLVLPSGGRAVDTPGFREFQLASIPPEEIGRHYPEFRIALGGCRFRDCLHQEEPFCAVRAAVDAGEISKFRYDNYLRILLARRNEAVF